ncbi:hypothetical protein J6590_027319 [Homalodisca vitripennis]|nr:hypothetical protein J6590_027319 [Homalodisca vitripennis]
MMKLEKSHTTLSPQRPFALASLIGFPREVRLVIGTAAYLDTIRLASSISK